MNEAVRQDTQKQTERISSLIRSARRHLAEGRTIDLTALEGMVRDLVVGLAKAAPENTSNLRTPLQAMLDELNGLENDLDAQQKDAIGGAEGTRLAAQAYGALKTTS